ncbi:Pycsar system effector family protein [Oricola cellulosilytica]|uniref:Pycsar effector protein domain-containing protein n=1 Tax=Oricola cellulosilytica TaxID=1429082 RepID=A0A4R0PMF4_9HYPH|nr:Pycsar system effector family protein [Oricola cellulosilytica]TCD16519.1 hypothetical protein E0D97_03615 [Oricola cellulosilytica]
MREPEKLEDVDLSLPLAGSEGHDINHVTRARIQYLIDQHQVLLTQAQFSDAKAVALVTILGLAVFGDPSLGKTGSVSDTLGYLLLGFSAASVLCCFWAVFPRYPASADRRWLVARDRWSWPSLASGGLGPADYADFMRTVEVSQMIQSLSLSNMAVARLLLRKYTALRIAFGFSLGVLVVVGIRFAGFG